MQETVDKYLIDGCMRCKYGATPQCKVNSWKEELIILREIVRELAQETDLIEEIKWGVPVYTHKGKNICTINALKASANIGFFKGVLLTDKHKILQQQGNLQSDRIVKFTNTADIIALQDILKAYILEAIALETSGIKVEFNKNPEPIPEELQQAFIDDEVFRKAFFALTAGRQRGYIIHFSQPKQSATRLARIEKCKTQIFSGIGLNDKYGKENNLKKS
jgi:uncharacterized protein YdeI (YjbR/CyaY-like superfamily)